MKKLILTLLLLTSFSAFAFDDSELYNIYNPQQQIDQAIAGRQRNEQASYEMLEQMQRQQQQLINRQYTQPRDSTTLRYGNENQSGSFTTYH